MSIKLNKTEIINIINDNSNIFHIFDKVYIFGSMLDSDKYSNDIDILLLYKNYSFDIQENIFEIIECLERKTSYFIDVTTLSFKEENEINFIEKLNSKFLCIK